MTDITCPSCRQSVHKEYGKWCQKCVNNQTWWNCFESPNLICQFCGERRTVCPRCGSAISGHLPNDCRKKRADEMIRRKQQKREEKRELRTDIRRLTKNDDEFVKKLCREHYLSQNSSSDLFELENRIRRFNRAINNDNVKLYYNVSIQRNVIDLGGECVIHFDPEKDYCSYNGSRKNLLTEEVLNRIPFDEYSVKISGCPHTNLRVVDRGGASGTVYFSPTVPGLFDPVTTSHKLAVRESTVWIRVFSRPSNLSQLVLCKKYEKMPVFTKKCHESLLCFFPRDKFGNDLFKTADISSVSVVSSVMFSKFKACKVTEGFLLDMISPVTKPGVYPVQVYYRGDCICEIQIPIFEEGDRDLELSEIELSDGQSDIVVAGSPFLFNILAKKKGRGRKGKIQPGKFSQDDVFLYFLEYADGGSRKKEDIPDINVNVKEIGSGLYRCQTVFQMAGDFRLKVQIRNCRKDEQHELMLENIEVRAGEPKLEFCDVTIGFDKNGCLRGMCVIVDVFGNIVKDEDFRLCMKCFKMKQQTPPIGRSLPNEVNGGTEKDEEEIEILDDSILIETDKTNRSSKTRSFRVTGLPSFALGLYRVEISINESSLKKPLLIRCWQTRGRDGLRKIDDGFKKRAIPLMLKRLKDPSNPPSLLNLLNQTSMSFPPHLTRGRGDDRANPRKNTKRTLKELLQKTKRSELMVDPSGSGTTSIQRRMFELLPKPRSNTSRESSSPRSRQSQSRPSTGVRVEEENEELMECCRKALKEIEDFCKKVERAREGIRGDTFRDAVSDGEMYLSFWVKELRENMTHMTGIYYHDIVGKAMEKIGSKFMDIVENKVVGMIILMEQLDMDGNHDSFQKEFWNETFPKLFSNRKK